MLPPCALLDTLLFRRALGVIIAFLLLSMLLLLLVLVLLFLLLSMLLLLLVLVLLFLLLSMLFAAACSGFVCFCC